MAFKNVDLNIDTLKRNNIPIEGINQEDNVKLNISVTENGKPKDLSNQTIKAYVKRIDGTLVEQADQITITEASQGKISIDLKNSAFNTEGYALFQLDISDSTGRITSSYATFKVGKGLVSGEAIENTNEIEALKQVETYLEKAKPALEKFISDESEFNKQEQQRQTNEAKRETKFSEVVASATESKTNLEGVIATAEEKNRILSSTTSNADDVKIALQKQTEKGQVIKQYFESNLDNATNVSNSLKTNVRLGDDTNALLKANIQLGKGVNSDLESVLPTATEKDRELKESIKNANDFINALEPDKDIPGLKIEINALKEGLQQNQELSYKGSSVKADGTLEGRTKGMTISGKTTYKRLDGSYTDTWEEGVTLESFGEKEGNKISILSCGKNLFNCNLLTPSGDQITNFKIDGSIISGDFKGQYNSTKSVKFAVTKKIKVLIKAYLKGCRLIIKDCWAENGEFKSRIDTNNWSNNVAQELLGSRIVYIDKNSSLEVENPHRSAHSFSVRELICYEVDGTENESYLPYRQDKKDILLKEPLRRVKEIKDKIFENGSKVKLERKVGKRTYQPGDENLENVMTDKQNTCYVLDTPTIEEIEGVADIDLDTYQTTTYFNVENAVEGELEFKVSTNLGSVIQNNALEINNIWDTINNLIIPTLFELKKNSAELLLKNNLK